DRELALRWVRDNIERFGGDPKRVLIFGQSGGGQKAAVLWSMPTARGLFNRVAMQSGAMRRLRSAEDGTEVGEKLLKQLGLQPRQARQLQQIPLQQQMAANFAMGKQPAQAG